MPEKPTPDLSQEYANLQKDYEKAKANIAKLELKNQKLELRSIKKETADAKKIARLEKENLQLKQKISELINELNRHNTEAIVTPGWLDLLAISHREDQLKRYKKSAEEKA